MQLNSGLWTVEHLAGGDLREGRYVKHTSNKLLLCNMKLSKRNEKLVRPQQRQSMKLVLTKAICACSVQKPAYLLHECVIRFQALLTINLFHCLEPDIICFRCFPPMLDLTGSQHSALSILQTNTTFGSWIPESRACHPARIYKLCKRNSTLG